MQKNQGKNAAKSDFRLQELGAADWLTRGTKTHLENKKEMS